VRSSRSNKETVIVAVVNGSTSVGTALDLGANFVLRKPIPETRLRSVLDIALDKMECEHRRYFRYGIDLPVRFRNRLGESFTGRMKNVSEGGLAIKRVDPMHLKGVVPVEFDIPSVESQTFQGKAEVVWSDCHENQSGLCRFLLERQGDGVAQAFQSMNQVASQVILVELIQIEVAEIVVGDVLGDHVIDGYQDLMADRHRGTLIPAPRLEAVKLVSQVCAFRPSRRMRRLD
jgi:hypothetical protein